MYNKLNAINFTYLLLDYYKELNISNEELLVLLMCDHLLKDDNQLVTIEQLEMKLSLPFGEIDKIFNSLLTKKYIVYETQNNDFVTSLTNLKRDLLHLYQNDLNSESDNKGETQLNEETKLEVFSSFEHYFNRNLNNTEKDMILKWLKNGIDTEIGERGALLSGGQRQRLAIARAFVKNAPIVILDEATSALDNKAEAVVQKAIDNLMKDRTVFVIAHRLSTVQNADKIVVVNDGQVVEEGTHESLLNIENGAYKALYNAQFKKKAA